jgi:hypothetical protein
VGRQARKDALTRVSASTLAGERTVSDGPWWGAKLSKSR